MTASAMTVGMVPMALALKRGSQMQAPLGLAVIGGLVMSTFVTLPLVGAAVNFRYLNWPECSSFAVD